MACDTIIDSYDESDYWNYIQALHPTASGPDSAQGATFTTPASPKFGLCKARFKLRRKGSPDGTLVAQLYAKTGTCGSTGKPTGSPLAESNPITAMDVTTATAGALYDFTFPEPYYELDENSCYCIAVVSKTGTNWNGSNYIMVGRKIDGTHDGNPFYFDYSSWDAFVGWDFEFYVYGEEVISTGDITVNAQDQDGNPLVNVEFEITGVGTFTTPHIETLTICTNYVYTITTPQMIGGISYRFLRWSDGNTDNPRTIHCSGDATLTIIMEERYRLTVQSSPVSGIDFTYEGGSQTTTYTGPWTDKGTVITLVMPENQLIDSYCYWFNKWEDDSTDRTRNVTLNDNITVTGYFILDMGEPDDVYIEEIDRPYGEIEEIDRPYGEIEEIDRPWGEIEKI